MSDKPLSEQIEQADASEFVRYAKILSKKIFIRPDINECCIHEYHDWEMKKHNFSRLLEMKLSHIAAAIMLADAIEGYELSIDVHKEVNSETKQYVPIYTVEFYSDEHLFMATHKAREMAVICVIAKKLESE